LTFREPEALEELEEDWEELEEGCDVLDEDWEELEEDCNELEEDWGELDEGSEELDEELEELDEGSEELDEELEELEELEEGSEELVIVDDNDAGDPVATRVVVVLVPSEEVPAVAVLLVDRAPGVKTVSLTVWVCPSDETISAVPLLPAPTELTDEELLERLELLLSVPNKSRSSITTYL